MDTGLRIKKIIFIGDENTSSVNFANQVHFVHGASNTGKSLLIEAIDYMLGKKDLRQVQPQSSFYNEISMQILLDEEAFTLFRKWPSDTFEVYSGHIDRKDDANFYSFFRSNTTTAKVKNISDFYFQNLSRPNLLANLWGEKSQLTIRLLSRIILSGEQKIISTDSPIVAGDTSENSKNKYVFKYILTGTDDSEVKTITRGKEFVSEKKGQVQVLEEVIESLKQDLNFPDESNDSLSVRTHRLEDTIEKFKNRINSAQERLSDKVAEKKFAGQELMEHSERLNSIHANLINFETLKSLYINDMDRLDSQEEAAFLLSINPVRECEYCGKASKAIIDDLHDINMLAKASSAEVNKIKSKLYALNETTSDLERQSNSLSNKVKELKVRLEFLDNEVERCTPQLNIEGDGLSELRKERSTIQADLKLRERINGFQKRLQDADLSKAPKQYKSEDFYPSSKAVHSFCEIYSRILKSINFPGLHKVEFDPKKFDVIIDGSPRDSNGKGVRAILHSVFKVALLMHCRLNNLYHPGIVILDSPLVTYRDPLSSKHGDLDKDERELVKTRISYYFLKFIESISDIGQFIVVENIDLPEFLSGSISVDTFYGENATTQQRAGLL
ncbi:hypothetical protein [Pseudoalteromonas luteoviolacea]|uniref:Rad50/SbcC-type AAA domain-containing protein n=1 Tax=Pseudoalteromonas luteoviolacea NCIMB 1942 TaxID=1365253 RepID=A0A167BMJ3_9GAMM|nr:hypothetical protein [Pseudoalteromonas luteoviolacea]KZN46704.1 hypothetical protein N482_11550 [Pseudoalteromonas luteoviolacea NCIMB 1942]